MTDTEGNTPPRGEIEHAKVWFKDGRECHKLKISGRTFWFWNGETCRAFCMNNDINAVHWKRLHEAQAFGFMELANATISFYNNDQECKVGRGDLNKDKTMSQRLSIVTMWIWN